MPTLSQEVDLCPVAENDMPEENPQQEFIWRLPIPRDEEFDKDVADCHIILCAVLDPEKRAQVRLILQRDVTLEEALHVFAALLYSLVLRYDASLIG